MSRLGQCGYGFFALACCASLHAAEPRGLELSLGIAFGYLDYEETDIDGRRLNRETGVLPGLVASVSETAGPWRAELAGSYFAAEVDYDGVTNLGNPARTHTDARISDLSLSVAHRLAVTQQHPVDITVGLGWRRWQRDIQSTPTATGVDETYDWPYVHLGVISEWPLHTGTVRGGLRLQQSMAPRLDARFGGGASINDLEPDAKLGTRLNLAWISKLSATRSIVIESWYETWRFDASAPGTVFQAGVPVGTAFEPASDTHFVGLSLSYRGWN